MVGTILLLLPDESFRRVLCVAAHPDDVEYGASSAVATWTARGVEVAYLMLTRGEAGMDDTEPDKAARLRTEQQTAACAAVGVTRLDFLDHPDGVLEASLALRRDTRPTVSMSRAGIWNEGSQRSRPTPAISRVSPVILRPGRCCPRSRRCRATL